MNADGMMKEYDAVEGDAQWTMIKMKDSTGRKKFTTSSYTIIYDNSITRKK